MSAASILQNVDAFLFDVFGTVVDWEGSIVRELRVRHSDGTGERKSRFLQVVYKRLTC